VPQLRQPTALMIFNGFTRVAQPPVPYSVIHSLHTPKLKDTIARALETIERSARLQAQLINDLLDISRITSGKLRLSIYPVDLVLVIEAAIDTVRLVAEAKAIQIESVLDPKAGHILGDANRFAGGIYYLMRLSSHLREGISRFSLSALMIMSRSQSAIRVRASVLNFALCLRPFRQAADIKNRQAGLGLGLAIVRHLIELIVGLSKLRVLALGKEQRLP